MHGFPSTRRQREAGPNGQQGGTLGKMSNTFVVLKPMLAT
jgi:hypothetical protein